MIDNRRDEAREKLFDEHIQPLVEAIYKKCKELDFPCVSLFQIYVDQDTQNVLYSGATYCPKESGARLLLIATLAREKIPFSMEDILHQSVKIVN